MSRSRTIGYSTIAIPINCCWKCGKCGRYNISFGELKYGTSETVYRLGADAREEAKNLSSQKMNAEWKGELCKYITSPKDNLDKIAENLKVDSPACTGCRKKEGWQKTSRPTYFWGAFVFGIWSIINLIFASALEESFFYFLFAITTIVTVVQIVLGIVRSIELNNCTGDSLPIIGIDNYELLEYSLKNNVQLLTTEMVYKIWQTDGRRRFSLQSSASGSYNMDSLKPQYQRTNRELSAMDKKAGKQPRSESANKDNYCRKCGAKLYSDSVYCQKCGTKIK